MIPDIDEKSVGKVEKLINAVWGLLVRNWGKLLVMALITILIWFGWLVFHDVGHPDEWGEEEYPEEEYYEDYQYEGKH